jgi:hypothetical protein
MERALQGYLRRPRLVGIGLGLAGLAVAVVLLFLWPWHSGDLRVLPLEIDGYRDNWATYIGRIGRDCFRTCLGDAMEVQARFSEPAYCYLIALNPDGKEQLCYPEDEETSPVKSADVCFPPPVPNRRLGFFITEGSGVQAFVLVASRQSLPCYREWKSRLGKMPWKRYDADGVWRFDGDQFKPLAPDRGEVRDLGLPKPLVELGQALRQHKGLEVIEAIVFPVKAPKPPNP